MSAFSAIFVFKENLYSVSLGPNFLTGAIMETRFQTSLPPPPSGQGELLTTQNNDEVDPLSNKTMSKGKSVACNLSNEINAIQANEATGNGSVNVKYTNDC